METLEKDHNTIDRGVKDTTRIPDPALLAMAAL